MAPSTFTLNMVLKIIMTFYLGSGFAGSLAFYLVISMAQLRFKELFHLTRVYKEAGLYKVTILYNQLVIDIKMASKLLNAIISILYMTEPFTIGLLWQIASYFNGVTRFIALFALFLTCIFNYTMYWMASSIFLSNKIIIKLLYSIQFDKTRKTKVSRITRLKIDSFVDRLKKEFVGFRCLYSIKFTKLTFYNYLLGISTTYFLLTDLNNFKIILFTISHCYISSIEA